MGPCWLALESPVARADTLSWCKFEVEIVDPKKVRHLEIHGPDPTLVVASLNMKTWMNPKLHSNEIVMISLLVHENGECCALSVVKPLQ